MGSEIGDEMTEEKQENTQHQKIDTQQYCFNCQSGLRIKQKGNSILWIKSIKLHLKVQISQRILHSQNKSGSKNPTKRSFQPAWFEQYKLWLRYDETRYGVFCHILLKIA